MSLLPIFLKLDDRDVLVVGAGEVAAGKIEGLVAVGARVTVVAPMGKPEVERLLARGAITWHKRAFKDSDIAGRFVVIAGTNFATVNQHVFRLCTQAGVLCNAVDDIPHCDFYYGSVVSRGDLQIAISTAGESPSFAQRLRKEIDAQLPKDLGPWLHTLGSLRREVLEAHPSGDERKQLLGWLGQRSVCESETCPSRVMALPKERRGDARTRGNALIRGDAERLLQEQNLLQKYSGASVEQPPAGPNTEKPGSREAVPNLVGAADSPRVWLVGAGPGDPDLLTMKAARLLASADLLLHDDLVPDAVVALAPASAEVVNVGKRCGRASITQARIHTLMIDAAHAGRTVVRLKSGDPLLFGRAGEEMDALDSAGIFFGVVPGVTAASAAAAAMPCSLTDRRMASSVLLSTGHYAPIGAEPGSSEERLDPEPVNPEPVNLEPTRVVYMPGRDLTTIAQQWRREGLPGDYPCVLVSRAGQLEQSITQTTLATLHVTAPGPAPVLLMGGAVFGLKSGQKVATFGHFLATKTTHSGPVPSAESNRSNERRPGSFLHAYGGLSLFLASVCTLFYVNRTARPG